MLAQRKQQSSSISATEAKNDFGKVLEKVIGGKTFVITKHSTPKAVMISVEQFEALSRPALVGMDAIRARNDKMLRDMQTPEHRAALERWFNDVTPQQMGKATVAAATRKLAKPE